MNTTEKGGKKAQSGRIEELAEKLVQPIIEQYGCTLWDVCFEKEGAMWYLRVLFDEDGGVDSDKCGEITEPINKLIDKQDFIGSIDILEVGSPGLTKKLRKPQHFRQCMGEKIRVTVRDEKGKEVSLYGVLSDYSEEEKSITLDSDGEKQTLPLSKCIKVNSDL